MEVCKKTRYASEKDANDDIARIRAKSKRETVPIRSYRCNLCGFWHLTSREDYREKINDLQKEIENLKSENSRLKSELELVTKGIHREVTLELRRDDRIKQLQITVLNKSKLVKILRKDNRELINKLMVAEKQLTTIKNTKQ